MHGGAYTIDDAIARNDDRTRWGWVGRLIGGPARSVYMAMGALFLQPERGLFFSRYDPDNAAFGAHDPGAALATFQDRFPTEMIRHPEATLTRWRSVQWPAGNRFGFVFVNSSGGARSWSTSKGGATHFDVPDTVPCVVHYTHSGSAGRPFDVDSIAGRWLTNGAYVYFGSHAEPYLQAFVPPSVLAGRVACGVPLGVAMRHLFDTRLVGQRETKTADGEKKLVSFNLSGPWKLAYFGDPGYRLEPVVAPRLDPEPPRRGQLDSFARFAALKPPDKTQRPAHLVTGTALARIDPKGRQLYDDVAWRRTYRKAPESYREEIQREAVRAWVASLRADRVALYDPDRLRKLAPVPKAIRTTLADGATSPEAARLVTELAREVLAGLATYPDSEVAREPALARWVLEVACCFPHPEGYRKQLFEWVRATCAQLGVPPAELQAAVLERDWVPEEARRVVTAEVH
jgi:hypothetical protein